MEKLPKLVIVGHAGKALKFLQVEVQDEGSVIVEPAHSAVRSRIATDPGKDLAVHSESVLPLREGDL
jgi:hypothetical protein